MKFNVNYHLLLYFFTLVIFTVLAYSPALNVGYYLDDYESILNNPLVREFNWYETSLHYPRREIGYASFALNFKLFQFDSFYMHLVNIIIHLLNGLIVFFLAKKLLEIVNQNNQFNYRWVPLLAAAFMLLAPLNSQPVIYAVQRIALLGTLFYALSILFYLVFRTSSGPKKYLSLALAVVSVWAGLHSRENILTLPLTLIAIEYFIFRSISSKRLLGLFTLGVATFLSLQFINFLGITNIIDLVANQTQATSYYTRWEYITQQFTSVFMYIMKFFIPTPLRLEYGIDLNDWRDWQTWVGLFIVLGGIILAFVSRNKRPLVAFLVLFYLIAHSLESFVIVLSDFSFEHRAYLPNIAFSILFAMLLIRVLQSYKPVLFTAVILWTGFSGYTIYKRAELWADPVEFYRHELSYLDNSARAYGGLASSFAAIGDMAKAETWFRASIVTGLNTGRLDAGTVVTYIHVLNNRGDEGRSKVVGAQALKVFKRHVDQADIMAAVASLDVKQGQCDFAQGMIKKALKTNPQNLLAQRLKVECGIE